MTSLFSEWYMANEYAIAAIQLVFAMVGMGAMTTAQDFMLLMKQPKSITIGLLLQMLVLPMLALLWIKLGVFPIGFALGIALFCVLPGGSASNVFTFMANGNYLLSIVLSAVASLLCILSIPMWLPLILGQSIAFELSMPAHVIVHDVALYLMLPFFVGMLIKYQWPARSDVIANLGVRCAMGLIALIVLGSLTSGRLDWSLLADPAIVYFAGFMVTFFALSFAPMFMKDARDASAVQIELVMRNVNLGILLMVGMFPASAALSPEIRAIGNQAFSVLLFCGGPALLASILVALWHRRRSSDATSDAL